MWMFAVSRKLKFRIIFLKMFLILVATILNLNLMTAKKELESISGVALLRTLSLILLINWPLLKCFQSTHQLKVLTCPGLLSKILIIKNRLLKPRFDTRHLPQIKSLSNEIKEYFHSKKVSKVKNATRGPKTNIWKAVKVTKDLST